LVERLSLQDAQIQLDLGRLHTVKQARAESAARYFDENAADWDRIRTLHVADNEVEAAVLGRLGDGPFGDILDIGTGTGRLLELLAPKAERAIGLDLSREMLALARANLDKAGLKNCSVRSRFRRRVLMRSRCIRFCIILKIRRARLRKLPASCAPVGGSSSLISPRMTLKNCATATPIAV
jgi:SAM-dependent methyltransferase